jgi:acyl-CoA synthetase (AMP-forming)/AMP-acid ligase II
LSTGIRCLTIESIQEELAEEWRESSIPPDHLAFLQYTSGSTGNPKGVMLTHQNLFDNSTLLARRFGYNADSHCVSWLPVYHDMGLEMAASDLATCGGDQWWSKLRFRIVRRESHS